MDLSYGALFILSFFVPAAQLKEITAKDVTDRLQRRYDMIDDATTQFEQHVRFGFSAIEESFSGTLTMKKPNRYRIESEHQTIVTDGVTVWAYSPANNQVIVDRYKENQNSISPEQFMLNLPGNYHAVLLGTEKDKEISLINLKLTPKDERSFVKSVKIWVEEGNWMIRKILVLDVNDTETTYTISSIKLNTNVRETMFAFTPPPGTEIVDLR